MTDDLETDLAPSSKMDGETDGLLVMELNSKSVSNIDRGRVSTSFGSKNNGSIWKMLHLTTSLYDHLENKLEFATGK